MERRLLLSSRAARWERDAVRSLAVPGLICLLAFSAVQADDVFPVAPDTCLTAAHPCLAVPVDILRSGAPVPGMRGYSIHVTLGDGLDLCDSLSSIVEGTYLSDVHTTSFHATALGAKSYKVDCAILGEPCGADGAAGRLFTLRVKRAGVFEGVAAVTVTGVILRDCANAPIAGAAGPAAELGSDFTAPAAVADLTATQVKTGNDTDGTTRIQVLFSPPADAEEIEVYRAPYGADDGASAYPEYDDLPGAGVPPLPAGYPPSARWQLTGVTSSGQIDQPADRGFYYYVAYGRDACGNTSAASNRAGGTLNYHLGDASDGMTTCEGDNAVAIADISLLGSHYWSTVAPGDPVACLDVGPTSDYSVDALPVTDNEIGFEDLMIFAMNYGVVSLARAGWPESAGAQAGRPVLRWEVDAPVGAGAEYGARLVLDGNVDAVKGLRARVVFDGARVVLVQAAAGEFLEEQGAFVRGRDVAGGWEIDAAALGDGNVLLGSGVVARLRFRAMGVGAPPRLVDSLLRDCGNRPIDEAGTRLPGAVRAPGSAPGGTTLRVQPNPAHGSAEIRLDVARSGRIRVSLHDAAGRRVRCLMDESAAVGARTLAFDGLDAGGEALAPGVYFVRLEGSVVPQTTKLIVIR